MRKFASITLLFFFVPFIANATTSYANPGGTGDRTAEITVTATYGGIPNLGWTDPSVYQEAVDGDTVVNGAYYCNSVLGCVSGSTNPGDYIQFDFGSGASKIIDQVRLYDGFTENFGTGDWSASQDGATFVTVASGAAFSMSPSGATTDLTASSTGYRYYRFTAGTSGYGTAGYLREVEFRIDDAVVDGGGTSSTTSAVVGYLPSKQEDLFMFGLITFLLSVIALRTLFFSV